MSIYSICYTVITASERIASHLLDKPDNFYYQETSQTTSAQSLTLSYSMQDPRNKV